MPRHGGRHVVLVHGAEQAMNAFKMEIAADLGLDAKIGTGMSAYRNLTTAEAGQLGGTMVRRIQAMGELMIKQRYESGEARLLPLELLPQGEVVRDISNNGNIQYDPALGNNSGTDSIEMNVNANTDAAIITDVETHAGTKTDASTIAKTVNKKDSNNSHNNGQIVH